MFAADIAANVPLDFAARVASPFSTTPTGPRRAPSLKTRGSGCAGLGYAEGTASGATLNSGCASSSSGVRGISSRIFTGILSCTTWR
jgi:hypothetical protein